MTILTSTTKEQYMLQTEGYIKANDQKRDDVPEEVMPELRPEK